MKFWNVAIAAVLVGLAGQDLRADKKEKVFKLEDGKYTITFVANRDGEKEEKEHEVKVTVKDGKVEIEREGNKNKIQGTLEGNEFKASVAEGPGKIELVGKLNADNAITGTLSGDFKGEKMTGTFTLVKKK